MNLAADTERFQRALAAMQRAVFRLETLQVYRGSGEDDWIAAFEAGDPAPPFLQEQLDWERMLRAHRAAERTWRRVHVALEPLSAYMRFELTWAYAPNAAAGEDIRVISVPPDGDWPRGVPRHDFWLIDGERYDAVYDTDGTWLGCRQVPEIGSAQLWQAAALSAAQPWRDFIAARPDLKALIPRG